MTRQPALFIGHGNPMHAVTDNPFAKAWRALGAGLPRPEAILCISAHWLTDTPTVCIAETPETIHDFSGFPPELFAVCYPAPGAPFLLEPLQACVGADSGSCALQSTERWGLDHGAWAVLRHLFPQADVPVAQLSLPRGWTHSTHFSFAQKLAPLREQNILILGSGNIVHNLQALRQGPAHDWATRFDARITKALQEGDDQALLNFSAHDSDYRLSVPTPEHYWPLLYAAAVRLPEESPQFFTAEMDLGSLSMRSVAYGL